jgi:plastocyanin
MGGRWCRPAHSFWGADEKWKPKHAYIGRGDRIRWKNPTSRIHDVRAYDKGTNWDFYRVLSPGESTLRKFRKRGTFFYRCARHSGIVSGKCRGMCGVIHVT